MKVVEGDGEMRRCTKGEKKWTEIEQVLSMTRGKKYGLRWLLANSTDFICFFHQKLWGKI